MSDTTPNPEVPSKKKKPFNFGPPPDPAGSNLFPEWVKNIQQMESGKMVVDVEPPVPPSVEIIQPPAEPVVEPVVAPYPKLSRITKAEWKALPEKAKWDAIVAMRGPDLKDSGTLKWFTTAILRHRAWNCFKAQGGSAVVNGHLGIILWPTGGFLKWPPGFDGSHFMGHIYDAATWLSVPIVPISVEKWSMILSGASVGSCCKAFQTNLGDATLKATFKQLAGGF